jgi:hypothetical protein
VLANRLRYGEYVTEVRRPILVGRRTDSNELKQAVVDTLLDIGGKFEPPCLYIPLNIVFETGLIDGYLAVVQPRDFSFIDINADNVITHLSQTRAGHQAYIT